MKYSFMSFSCPQLTLDEMLAAAIQYGYDGVEPRVASKHAHGLELDCGAEVREEARAKAADKGVAICCVATSCRYADPAIRAEQVDDTRLAIDLAADLGAPCIRVFGGQFPAEVSRAEAVDGVAGALLSVAEQAHARAVTVCMETHDAWCDPADVAAVMQQVDHPNVAVNWDIMHPIRRGAATMDSAFAALEPWVRHLHVHDGADEDGKLVLKPIGEGIIDHRRAIELLKPLPYTGYISGEWIGWSDPYDVHLPREVEAMKRYEAEAG